MGFFKNHFQRAHEKGFQSAYSQKCFLSAIYMKPIETGNNFIWMQILKIRKERDENV